MMSSLSIYLENKILCNVLQRENTEHSELFLPNFNEPDLGVTQQLSGFVTSHFKENSVG